MILSQMNQWRKTLWSMRVGRTLQRRLSRPALSTGTHRKPDGRRGVLAEKYMRSTSVC